MVADDFGTLEGTLEVPSGCEGMPVVLILSGSGPEDRDGNPPRGSYQTDMYKLLALGLRDAGFAALRFDDPGVVIRSVTPSRRARSLLEMRM
jgi:hypothetical protein